MPVTLPDASKFDSDSDTIKESRPELKKMADAINTIGAEYNAGTLGGGGGIQEIVAGTNITVSSPDSAGSVTIDSTASGLSNVVDDTTPQLGGDLDVNEKKIISTASNDIILEPDSDNILLKSVFTDFGDGTNFAVARATNGCNQMVIGVAGSTNAIRVKDGAAVSDSIELDTKLSGDPIYLKGPVKIEETTGTPTDTTNPAKWLKIEITDSTASAGSEYYYIKLYQ